MAFDDLVKLMATYFPNANIAYKDQSLLMKLLGYLLFFNPDFMTTFTTTIGNTIYFPSEDYVKAHPVSAQVILLHEMTHLYDKKRLGTFLFTTSYLLPQLLAPFTLLLLFVLSWKFVLPLFILCLLPLPAYFRTYFEKRAYMVAMYVIYLLSKKENFDPKLTVKEEDFLGYIHGSGYYFMWPFAGINAEFDAATKNIEANNRPFTDDALFTMIEALIKNS